MDEIDKLYFPSGYEEEESDMKKIAEHFNSYVGERYNAEWKVGLTWSFRTQYKKFSNLSWWMKRLCQHALKQRGVKIFDGIYVGEYNRNKDLHIHAVIYYESTRTEKYMHNLIWKFCSTFGSVQVSSLNNSVKYLEYISKGMFSSDQNSYNYLGFDIDEFFKEEFKDMDL